MKGTGLRLFFTGAVVQILVAIGHLVGHFTIPRPANETEKQLVLMMSSYQKEVAGGKMSILEAYDGLNVSYALFFLFAGNTNLIVLRKQKSLLKPMSLLNAAAMGVGGVIAAVYFFWIPIVYFGICLVLFVTSSILLAKSSAT
jgi:hypothetical protein